MSGIRYILNSDKPYPIWIKEHRVFKNINKIDKVFPKIGLPNFSEDIEISCVGDAKVQAKEFVYQISVITPSIISNLKKEMRATLLLSGRERNEKCNNIQAAINIISHINEISKYEDLVSIVNDKVVLSLNNDIFSGSSTSPLFRKGEPLFRVITKCNAILEKCMIPIINYETLESFKEFSKLNIPNKKYKLTFSSTGSDGAWDIATASMRGIASCQSWTAVQARGLIGSIVSKYVGVLFVEGNKKYSPYGKQMIYRAMVRLILNRRSGQPALFVDTIYPSFNTEAYESIKKCLMSKTIIPIYFACNYSEKDKVIKDYIILDEPSRIHLREGEYSYTDTLIPVELKKVGNLNSSSNENYLIFTQLMKNRLQFTIDKNKLIYEENFKQLKTFLDSGNNKKKRPEFENLFQDTRIGVYSISNMLNFFAHFNKPGATTKNPTSYFLDEIFKSIGVPQDYSSQNKICFWMLKTLSKDFENIKKISSKAIINCSCNKKFPKASARFLNTLLFVLKKELYSTYQSNVV